MPTLNWGRLGAFNALAAVGVGSFGAHRYEWDAQRKQSFLFAQMYHFVSAGAMMALNGPLGRGKTSLVGLLLLLGTLLFSGTVYHRCFTTERHVAHKLAPAGGVCLMSALLMMALL